MGKKSFLPRLEIQHAQRAHGCQFNSNHRILMGQARLYWKNGRDEANYCVSCALGFLRADLATLQGVIADLEAILAEPKT